MYLKGGDVMNNLNLKNILLMRDVKENIRGNMNMSSSEIEHALETTINSIENNFSKVELTIGGELVSFENTLCRDSEKSIYLLSSRLFRKSDDNMIGTYLEVFNQNGEINSEYIDDVDAYGNWEAF